MTRISNRVKIIGFSILFGIVTFLTLNIHSRAGEFNYHSEIFSDKAGYYIYLPASILYRFDVNAFPDSIEYKTGTGFFFDRENNKISTKYPYGVAVLEAPFFIAAHVYTTLSGGINNGFSRPYHNAIDVAAAFYVTLGLYFLFMFLRNYYDDKVILVSLFFLLFGTNLYYYSTQETGLSHVYSFFLLSVFICYWKKYIDGDYSIKNVFVLATSLGLAIVVRPINGVFIPFLLLLDAKTMEVIKARIVVMGWKWLIVVGIGAILVFPQLAYYYYLYGKPFAYSYGNESFIYKFSPQFHRVLFTFENGLFIYNPIHIFTILGMILMIKAKKMNGLYALLLFVTITWVYASWWSPILGCGLGNRGFVEFYTLLIIPFAFSIDYAFKHKKKAVRFSLFGILFLLMVYNLKFSYAYDGCWYGTSPWDYKEYLRLLLHSI